MRKKHLGISEMEEGRKSSSKRDEYEDETSSEYDEEEEEETSSLSSEEECRKKSKKKKKDKHHHKKSKHRYSSNSSGGVGLFIPVALSVSFAALVFWREIIAFDAAVRSCSFPKPSGALSNNILRMAILADARVVDSGSMFRPFGVLSELRGDLHLRKVYRRLHEEHSPDVVVFLGDILDVGRRVADDTDPRSIGWSRLVSRWQTNFIPSSITDAASAKTKPTSQPPLSERQRRPGKDYILISACGERDVGTAASDVPRRAARFAESFGELHAVTKAKDFDLVRICAPAMLYGDAKQRGLASKVLVGLNRSLRAAVAAGKPLARPRVLLTHVPLWKPPDSAPGCPGYSQMMNETITEDILGKVSPFVVISSGGSKACVASHHAAAQEHSVAKVSIVGSGTGSSFALVTLQINPETKAASAEVATCSMPSHVLTFVLYGISGAVATVYTFFHTSASVKWKKKNVSKASLSTFSHMVLVLTVFTASQVLCALVEWNGQ